MSQQQEIGYESDSDVSFLDELDASLEQDEQLAEDETGEARDDVEKVPHAANIDSAKKRRPIVVTRTMVEVFIIIVVGSLLLQVTYVTWQRDSALTTIRLLNEKLLTLQNERNELFDELQEVSKDHQNLEEKVGQMEDSTFLAVTGLEHNPIIKRFSAYPWTLVCLAIYTIGVFILCVRSTYREENRQIREKYEELLKKADQKKSHLREELTKLRGEYEHVRLENRQFVDDINNLHEQLHAQMPEPW